MELQQYSNSTFCTHALELFTTTQKCLRTTNNKYIIILQPVAFASLGEIIDTHVSNQTTVKYF